MAPSSFALRILLALAAGATLLPFTPAALALPAGLSLSQLHHSRWTLEQGAPTGAYALAQTRDGALWVGAPGGLFRFDGLQFDRFALPGHEGISHGDISALAATPDGGLWIGLRYGGMHFWRDGRLRSYGPAEGLPGQHSVIGMNVRGDLPPLAALTSGVYMLDGERWRRLGQAPGQGGPSDGPVIDVLRDREGRIWAAGRAGVHVLAPGGERFERVAPGSGFLDEAPDGSLWHSGENPTRLSAAAGPARAAGPGGLQLKGGTGQLLLDRDGGLWFAYMGGIARIPDPRLIGGVLGEATEGLPAFAQSFTPAQGLSGNIVRAMLEDRDGNIWLATNGGLDRFRAPRFTRIDHDGLADATLAPAPDGGVLSCSPMNGTQALDRTHRPTQLTWMRSYCQTLRPHPDGSIWVGGASGLRQVRDGVAQDVPRDAVAADLRTVWAMDFDRDGALWLASSANTVFRLHAGVWESVPARLSQLPKEMALVVAAAPAGGVWLGYSRNRLAFVDAAGRARLSTTAQGLAIGHAQVVAFHAGGVLAGGSAGLAWLHADGRAQALRGTGDERFAGTSGLVSTPDGALWINSLAGVSRVTGEALRRSLADPARPLDFERFDHRDGLQGTGTQLSSLPSAMRHPDGRLWFSTTRGLFTLDPERLSRNERPPAVEILGLQVGDRRLPPAPATRLDQGTTQLEIAYTAFSIGIPERVRFRYRLDGVDRGWQEAGTRRRAFYTNLGPGQYRFEVQAANEDGVWNPQAARLDFGIAPRYYQTPWFMLLCAAGVMLLLWGLYRLRLRRLGARLQARLEAQAQERERIARELHDTLLQSTQGLILSFEAVARRSEGDAAERQRLEQALSRAEAVMAEGRRRVHDLRAPTDPTLELTEALLRSEAGAAGPPTLRGEVRGQPRRLHPWVLEELLRLGQEGILNARRHARATRIELWADYGEQALEFGLHDDGCGIAAEILNTGARPGHWGLPGMRERAARLGGTLTLTSAPAGGTTLRLTLPAARAYVDESLFGRWRRRLRAMLGRPD